MDKSDYIEELKVRDKALEVQKVEVGIDYYYRCHWLTCNAEVRSYMNFCPICGQRLDFEVNNVRR